ncbi:MAG: sulfite exporter TauE/SafE family protein [Pseudomonadota bacterium]
MNLHALAFQAVYTLGMEIDIALPLVALACGVAVFAGVVKGIVGFAMPMVLVSGLGSFLAPELALAGLILPTLVTNAMQALRQGFAAMLGSLRRYRLFLAMGGAALLASSQLFSQIPANAFYLLLGVPVTLYAVALLLGVPLKLNGKSRATSVALGLFAGAIGGISGVWGPVTVAYLTAYELSKEEQMRVQGAIYGLGAVLLAFAHLASGVLDARTIPFSALLVLPAVLGLWIGFRIQDRMDQSLFKKATLVVLAIAGLNLIRRGLFG